MNRPCTRFTRRSGSRRYILLPTAVFARTLILLSLFAASNQPALVSEAQYRCSNGDSRIS